MRKRGIIYLLVIALIVAAIAYFTQDRFLERQLELALQSIAGAKVEIDNFHFSLLKAKCSWNRLQVANSNDPWRNVIETGRATFDLETRPLFWRRVIINEMSLENVRTGTQRKTDGSIPKQPEPLSKSTEPGIIDRAKAALQQQLGDAPIFDLSGLGKKLKVDSLINVENLASVQAYKALRSTADSTFDYWRSQLDVKTYTARVNDLETRFKSLKLEKINEIKDVVAVVELGNKVDDIRKDANSLKKDVEGKHEALTQTFTDLQGELKAAQNSIQSDIEKAKQLAKLKDLDVKDVAMVLFGSAVVEQYDQLLDRVAMGRKYLDKAKQLTASQKVEKPPRFKGQDIHFPFHYRYPKFLLRQAKLSAATAGDTSRAYFLDGTLTGLTTQPDVFGRPTRFKVDLMRVSGNKYNLAGSLDHITDQAKDSLWLSAENFGLGKINLKKSKYFPQAISAQKGNIHLAGFFVGNGIDLKLNLDATPITFTYAEEASDRIAKIIRQVLDGLTNLNLKAQLIGGAESDFKLNLNSNIDNLLANQVKLTIAQNLREAQQQVESYVRTEADKKRKEVEAIVEENRQKLYVEIDKAKQKVNEITAEIDRRKQELEERKKKLEADAKKKVFDFIKKPGD